MRRIDGLKLAALAAGALLVMAPDRKDPLTNFLFSLKIDPLVKTLRPEEAGVRAVRGA
jgi:hypothetical protein